MDEKNGSGFTRRLAAVLCADVASYTRLMEANEDLTHATFRSHLSEVLQPEITRHRGRLVKSTGDGLIASFDSAIEALESALAIQEEIARRNADVEAHRRLEFRIGINLGDVITEDDDIYGTGVNVAARIQEMATPGGICISDSVHALVRNSGAVKWEGAGRQRLKNVADPIRVYRSTGRIRRLAKLRRRLAAGRRLVVIVSSLLVALVGVAGLGWYLDRWPAGDADPVPWAATPDSGKPAIAVLPFIDASPDQTQSFFAEGIAQDIITDLSQVSGLVVIARNSSFTFRGRDIDVRKIGRDLGVEFLLRGSVRKVGDQVRINATLVDTATGMHRWAARYDSAVGEVFALQDRISNEIVSALAISMKDEERNRLTQHQSENVAAYETFLRGWEHYQANTESDTEIARAYFEKATELDPNYAQAHAAVAAAYLAQLAGGWYRPLGNRSREDLLVSQATRARLKTRIRDHIVKALQRPTSFVHRVNAQLLSFDGSHDDAIQQIVRAISLEPNDAENYALLGTTLVWAGRAQEAIAPLQTATRLDPLKSTFYSAQMGIAHFAMGKFRQSVNLLSVHAGEIPGNDWPLVHLISAYGHLDRKAEAKVSLDRLNGIRQRRGQISYSAVLAERDIPYKYADDRLRLILGLHKAGVPSVEFAGPDPGSP